VTQDRDTSARPGPAAAAPDGAGGAGGDETLSEAFRSVARQLRETSQEALAPWDITPSQLRALRVLARHGGMRLSALSDHLRIAARSATEVADALEARGLVERRPDPGDRRATLVELTGPGRSVLDAIRAVSGTAAERAFDRLSQADRAHLARILRKLRD
jgi:DNA-binding MarR family transcriptional regulator